MIQLVNTIMVRTTGLTKYYGSFRAVDNVSLRAERGEILGLLGPNGAGKTTTMRMITGVLRPSAGKVEVDGIRVDEDPVSAKRLIGYLPESTPLYPEMLAYDFLRYIAQVRYLPAEKIEAEIQRVCDLCGLREVMHKAVSELSRGYRQRVGLAHAIIGDPQILILDEATAGLDPNQIVEIRSLIRELGREKAVIFSTHALSEAEATCDRIVIIHRGRVAADSTPAALKQSLAGASTLRITVEGAKDAELLSAISSLPGVAEVAPLPPPIDASAVSLRVVCSEEARRTVYRRISSEKWVILEITVEQHSMEDAFRELTEHQSPKGRIDGR